jgi:hypothetical protein
MKSEGHGTDIEGLTTGTTLIGSVALPLLVISLFLDHCTSLKIDGVTAFYQKSCKSLLIVVSHIRLVNLSLVKPIFENAGDVSQINFL